jgi:hypothetical protein
MDMKIPRITAWLVTLSSLVLIAAACGSPDDLIRAMNSDSTVDYGEGGRMYVLLNHCLTAYPDTDSDGYKSCTLPEGYFAGPPDIGEPGGTASPDARVEVLEFSQHQVEQVIPWVHRFGWIAVNPSMCSIRCAVNITSLQMKVMGAPGVVLVYLPQGPDRNEIMSPEEAETPLYEPSWATRENAVHRFLCGRFANDHPQFHENMTSLVDQVTHPVNGQGEPIDGGRNLIVSAYSYSVPLAMETIRDNIRVVFLAVSPTFGWQRWRGSTTHNHPDPGDSCNPTSRSNSLHELETLNPHVATWQDNLATHLVPTCLYMSYGDCISQNFDGVAMAKPAEDMHCNDFMTLDDRASYNHIDHTVPRDVAFLPEPPSYPGLSVFDPDHPGGWRDMGAWSLVFAGRLIGSLRVAQAISANFQSVDTLRLIPVRTTTAALDRSYDRSWTRTYSEQTEIGHMGYWQNGNMPDPAMPVPAEHYTANFNFRDYICDCPSQLDHLDCPACDDLDRLCRSEHGETHFSWMLDPVDRSIHQRLGTDGIAPAIKDNDVFWYPTDHDLPAGGIQTAFADLEDVWGADIAAQSGRIGAVANRTGFQMNLVPDGVGRGITQSRVSGGAGLAHQSCADDPTYTTYRRGITATDGMIGAYAGLRGHWADLELSWWDDVPGACGDYAQAYRSGPHRVLFMRMDGLGSNPQEGDYSAAFVQPVLDVRNIDAPETICVDEGPLTISAQVYQHAATDIDYFSDPVWGEWLYASISEGHYSGNMHTIGCVDNDCDLGRIADTDFTFDPMDIWCRVNGTIDSLCSGSGRGSQIGVQARFWAFNASGDPFYQIRSMTLERCD